MCHLYEQAIAAQTPWGRDIKIEIWMLTLKRLYIYNVGDRFQIARLNGDVHFTQAWGQFNETYKCNYCFQTRKQWLHL